MDGHEFEDLIEQLLIKMGFITQERKKSADGGIDIQAINEQPIFKGKYIIQCKRYSKPVGASVVRDLYGVVTSERANKGIMITNSSFTEATKEFAKGKPIELIDGEELSNLLDEYLKKRISDDRMDISQGVIIPESYKTTVEILEPAVRMIAKKRDNVKNKVVYLKKKYYSFSKSLVFYQTQINKLSDISLVQGNQLKYLNELWQESIKNKETYVELQKIRAHCKEIIATLNTLEAEWEEVISTQPPDGLRKIYNIVCEMYENNLDYEIDFFLDFFKRITDSKDITSEKDFYLEFEDENPDIWQARINTALEEAKRIL